MHSLRWHGQARQQCLGMTMTQAGTWVASSTPSRGGRTWNYVMGIHLETLCFCFYVSESACLLDIGTRASLPRHVHLITCVFHVFIFIFFRVGLFARYRHKSFIPKTCLKVYLLITVDLRESLISCCNLENYWNNRMLCACALAY